MQILSHTYELNSFLEQDSFKKRLNNKCDSALLIEWNELRKLMWSKNCIISPGKFIKTIQKVAQLKDCMLFTGYSQNDVSEFFLFIIDCFHTSLAREIKITISGEPENDTDLIAIKCFEMIQKMYSNEYSEIWNLFYAVHVSSIIDVATGKHISITPEPFFMIDLSIPPGNKCPSLIDCFEHYVKGEIIDGWKNDDGQMISIKKTIQFWSLPNILAIDLKRFNNNGFQKNQICVNFPLKDLDLSKYVIGYKSTDYKYELYGVCNHSGGTLGGHYTAYVKNANEKWYEFNDTTVSEISEDRIISPKAYVLFYRKMN